MELTLKVISGKYAGQLIKVPHQRFMIGRSEECHLRPHSELISRQHCVIITENDEISVEDLGSRNGTYVNGEKITERRSVDPGDKVKVGQLEFELYLPRSKDSAAMAVVAPAGPAAKPAPAPSESMNQTVANKSAVHDTSSLKTAGNGNPAGSTPAKTPAIPGVPPGAKLPSGNMAPSIGGPRLPKVQSTQDVVERVSAKKSVDDGDIDDWLSDDNLDNLNDTRTIQLTPALQAQLLADAAEEAEAEEEAEKEAKASDSKASNKKVYGKLPPVPKQVNAAKDSREAAADVLRKMLKNR